jgi:uncharacterized membrane protein YgcG
MSSEPSTTSPPSQLVTVADLAQVLAQLTSAMRPETESGPKAQEPEKYDGDPDRLEAYLTSLHLVFCQKPGRFPTVQSQVLYAMSFLKEGRAQKWTQSMLKKIEKREVEFETWEKFEEVLKEAFQTGSVAERARDRLKRLSQGNREVENYIADFEMYEADTDFGGTALVEFFQKGLHRDLIRNIYGGDLPKDDDLEMWKRVAIKWDRQRRQFEYKFGGGQNRGGFSGGGFGGGGRGGRGGGWNWSGVGRGNISGGTSPAQIPQPSSSHRSSTWYTSRKPSTGRANGC